MICGLANWRLDTGLDDQGLDDQGLDEPGASTTGASTTRGLDEPGASTSLACACRMPPGAPIARPPSIAQIIRE